MRKVRQKRETAAIRTEKTSYIQRNRQVRGAKSQTLHSPQPSDLGQRSCVTDNDTLAKTVLEQLMLSYDLKTVPIADGVDVKVDLMIQAISSISEIAASFTADVLDKFNAQSPYNRRYLAS
ncbi:unnamed protein product [Gongylonema pulchrum]|uniref:Neur_chan_LBD domain-containing protein n=1 Tax=Gongylonema pulchrum TaxID=637853 RepID=A0A183CWJ7_9BILA|nr:unnamed protein product [Gongylonema pulchrum]